MDAAFFVEEAGKLERLLYAISWSMLSNREDCADAVQEALTKAWKSRETLKNSRAFKPWLTRIMINTCRDMQRDRSQHQWVELEENMLISMPKEWERMDIRALLNELPPEQKTVLVLHYMEGYKLREIARIMDIPMGTVKTRLMYARKKLQNQAEGLEKGGTGT